MKHSDRRRYRDDGELSPRERRELQERGEWNDEEEPPRKAPIIYRVVAWASLVVVFFALGYGVMSLTFRWMDKGSRQRNVAAVASSDVTGQQTIGSTDLSVVPPAEESSALYCTLSIPEGNSFISRRIRCSDSIPEDNIRQTLLAYLDAVKERQMLEPAVQSLHIFQSGDWLFINMNGAFLSSLKTQGGEKSRLLLTGLVKTMADNFEPITKVKFYIDGKEPKGSDPVNLTMPWSLPASRS